MKIEKSKGKTMEEIAITIGVHALTLAKWKSKFGSLQLDHAKRLKELAESPDLKIVNLKY
jgi:transcriptional regulator with XRE-family HTH domain